MKRWTCGLISMLLCVTLLAGCGSKTDGTASNAAKNDTAVSGADGTSMTEPSVMTKGYRVVVKNPAGVAVKGVTVQFCSDGECTVEQTDENGMAGFAYPDGDYKVHILKVPEGYAEDEKEYTAPKTAGEMEIILSDMAPQSEESNTDDDSARTVTAKEFGIKFTKNDAFDTALSGSLNFGAQTVKESDPAIKVFEVSYYAVAKEQWSSFAEYVNAWTQAYYAGQDLPKPPVEAWENWRELGGEVCSVFIVDNSVSPKEVRDFVTNEYYSAGEVEYFSKADSKGNTDFYFVQCRSAEQEQTLQKSMGAFYDEYQTVRNNRDGMLSCFEFFEPESGASADLNSGKAVSAFETTDLDGVQVSAAELFAKNKLTLVNIWATWCGPCKNELPELAKLAKDLEAKGCQLIGICYDAADEETLAKARALLSAAGCDYLNLTPPKNLKWILPFQAYPTTYYIDSKGKIAAEATIGARVDEYERVVEEYLSTLS